MVSIRELLKVIEEKDAKIDDLRGKIGNLSQSMTDAYLNFAVLIGLEIGKLHGIDPEILDIRIMLDGKIIVQAGKVFRLEFDNYNKLIQHLLCMVRLIGIQDGADVITGKKTQATVYYEMEDDCVEKEDKENIHPVVCASCGTILPPNDPDDPVISDLCESCYQNGET